MATTLYHGSKSTLTEILASTDGYVCFGGVFASVSQNTAESFGDNIHTIEIEDDQIAENRDLWDAFDGKKRRAMIKAIKESTSAKTAKQVDAVFEIIADDENPEEELFNLFYATDWAEASWKAQFVRGQVAKAAGFRAVKMSDEFGTSYLVLGGLNTKIEVI